MAPQFEWECSRCHAFWQGCTVQADMVPDQTEGKSSVTMETTTFQDTMPGVSIGDSTSENPTDYADAVISAGLTDFLARPVRIANFTWLESDAVGILQTVSPWNAFFNNAAIKYKLNNFAFLRCDLKLKIVVNASPFYYGAMRMCYQPLPNFTPSTIVNDAGGTRYFIPYSQQPGIWIKPQLSEGGEMTLPFFYPRNFLRIQRASDTTDMGTLRFINYAALQSANGITGQGCTIQVYAWAENVVLGGPSTGLAMQSDEYGTGPVSGPASTVARIAGLVKGVPVIGKFATATEMGARAVSGIAKLFGFTNVPVIEPTQPLRPSPFPQLASAELGYPTEKLTIDSKNELSIDPSTIGLPSQDDLSIESFAGRQSYLTTTTWTTAQPVDTPLFTTRVNCTMFDTDNATQAKIYRTPMAVLASLFANWRGDVIFTFKFVASQYHKGRVRISYDPTSSGVQTTGDTGSQVFNTIVDLGIETEVEVRIPYQQSLAWLRNGNSYAVGNVPFTTSSSPAQNVIDDFDNGILSVKILTLLTAPVGTSNVPILVFVRAAENIEFANPQPCRQDISQFVAQSLTEEVDGMEAPVGHNVSEILVPRSRVNFGEEIRSMRQLLRRTNLVDTIVPATDTNDIGYWYYKMQRFPPYFGFDTNGIYQAKGLVVTASNFQFNYSQVNPWHVIAPCFVAHKGSAMWHFNVDAPTGTGTVLFARNNYNNETNTSTGVISQAYGSTNSNVNFYRKNITPSAGGAALTNQITQSGLSVSIPNYTNFKFESTAPGNFTAPPAAGSADDGSRYESSYLFATTNGVSAPAAKNMRIWRYFSVGTDYNLYFFLNVPTIYLYSGTIVPT